MLTEERVAAITAREQAATAGPWMLNGKRADYPPDYVWAVYDQNADNPYHPVAQQLAEQYGIQMVAQVMTTEADRVFIAAARTDIPDLLAERAALLAEIARLRAGNATTGG